MRILVSSWEADKLLEALRSRMDQAWREAWVSPTHEQVLDTQVSVGDTTLIDLVELHHQIDLVMLDQQEIRSGILRYNVNTQLPRTDLTLSDALTAVAAHKNWSYKFAQFGQMKRTERKETRGSAIVVACTNFDPAECRSIAAEHETRAQMLQNEIHELNNVRAIEVRLVSNIAKQAAEDLGLQKVVVPEL